MERILTQACAEREPEGDGDAPDVLVICLLLIVVGSLHKRIIACAIRYKSQCGKIVCEGLTEVPSISLTREKAGHAEPPG